MTSKDIIKLIQEHKHDGTYLNYHANIVGWLMYQEHTDSDYFIEVIDSHDHVRIWSSLSAYNDDKTRQLKALAPLKQQKTYVESNPMIDELKRAIEGGQWERVIEIKKQMRVLDIDFDESKYSLKTVLKEKGKIR